MYQLQLKGINDLDWERSKARLQAEMAGLHADISWVRADLLKWMFVYSVANVLTVGALLVWLI